MWLKEIKLCGNNNWKYFESKTKRLKCNQLVVKTENIVERRQE